MHITLWSQAELVCNVERGFCFDCRCSRTTALHWESSVVRVWLITRSALAWVRTARWSLQTTITTSIWRCSVRVESWWERWKAPWNTTSATMSRLPMTGPSSLRVKTTTSSSTSILCVGCRQMLQCHCWNRTFKHDLPRHCQQPVSVNGNYVYWQ